MKEKKESNHSVESEIKQRLNDLEWHLFTCSISFPLSLLFRVENSQERDSVTMDVVISGGVFAVLLHLNDPPCAGLHCSHI